MWLTKTSVNNPVMTTMVMMAIVVIGLLSFYKLEVSNLPKIDFPVLIVNTTYPGASSEIVETTITKNVERAVNTLNGIKNIHSVSYNGSSSVIAEFRISEDINAISSELRSKLDMLFSNFNSGINRPVIRRVDLNSSPVIVASVYSHKNYPLVYVSSVVKNNIIKNLESVYGVGSIDVYGDKKSQVEITLDPDKMSYYGIDLNTVVSAISANNLELPVGYANTGYKKPSLIISGKIKNYSDFANIIVKGHTGNSVLFKSFTKVKYGTDDSRNLGFINNSQAMLMFISKIDGMNSIELAKNIRSRLKEMKTNKLLPEDIDFKILEDNSVLISRSVYNLIYTIFEGLLITLFIVIIFMRSWRSMIITGISLPVSLIGCMSFIYAFSYSLNNITLLALSICVGFLIDDAIVVRENIGRHILNGADNYTAAIKGTEEIGLAVLATTSTIIAMFMPMCYMDGIMGRLFIQFGVTVSVASLISLIVSFTVDPMLSSIWKDDDLKANNNSFISRSLAPVARLEDKLKAIYLRVLNWSLNNRLKVIFVAILSFVVGIFILIFVVNKEFLPTQLSNYINIRIEVPNANSLDELKHRWFDIDKYINSIPEIDFVFAKVSNNRGIKNNNINISVIVKKPVTWPEMSRIKTELITKLRAFQDISINAIYYAGANNNKHHMLTYEIKGSDTHKLINITKKFMNLVKNIPGVENVYSRSLNLDHDLYLDIDRQKAYEQGISIRYISNTLASIMSDSEFSKWESEDGIEHPVILKLDNSKVLDLPIFVGGQGSGFINLKNFSKLSNNSRLYSLDRSSLLRYFSVSVDIKSGMMGDVSKAIDHKIRSNLDLPPMYSISGVGASEEMSDAFSSFLYAIGVGIVFMYMVIASQFKSYIHPIVVMCSLPLSIIGVAICLLLFRTSLNIMSMIGLVMLMGLVAKNAILLIDFAIRDIERGSKPIDAILRAGDIRFKPILMTSFAMLGGILFNAFSSGDGVELRQSLAQVTLGGIITSTLLTLIVIPVVFVSIEEKLQSIKNSTRPNK